jgi:chromosome segregation ATPase
MVGDVEEGTDATKGTTRRKPARSNRNGGEGREAAVSAKTLMGRLERQSGELAIVEAKLRETERALDQEREEARLLRQAFEDERAARERLQAQLKRERRSREEADRGVEEARATVSALEGQLQLLRAKVKALEHETRHRGRFRLRRGR